MELTFRTERSSAGSSGDLGTASRRHLPCLPYNVRKNRGEATQGRSGVTPRQKNQLRMLQADEQFGLVYSMATSGGQDVRK